MRIKVWILHGYEVLTGIFTLKERGNEMKSK